MIGYMHTFYTQKQDTENLNQFVSACGKYNNINYFPS